MVKATAVENGLSEVHILNPLILRQDPAHLVPVIYPWFSVNMA